MNRKRSINAESMSICQVDHLVYVLEFLESLLLAGHEIMGAARHKTKLFERSECEEHRVFETCRLLNFSTSPAFALGWEIRKLVSSNAYFTMQISAWCAFFDIKMREMREMPEMREMREMQSMTFRTKEIAVREINSDARPSCRDDAFIITQLFQHMSL